EAEQATQAAQRARSRFVNVWGQQVREAWTRPPGSQPGLSADVRVRVMPTGEVADVEVVRSSGDSTFDRSVELAVLRASPLRVPDDSDQFRRMGLDNIVFRFTPDG
ncbi:MAG: TonB C-terminal domain-containing protein, partial [Ectothiorhodospiraceae bacterium]|nr:TonB C-terminal domain-containing protein [Ectothiorhodospiraceae bacterium]